MKLFKYIFLGLIIIFYILTLVVAFRSKKGIKFVFANAALSVLVFFLLYFFKDEINLFFPLNYYTFFSSLLFGLPGILLILVLNLLM